MAGKVCDGWESVLDGVRNVLDSTVPGRLL